MSRSYGRYGVSLSQYLGDRDINDNPMGTVHENESFGQTAQSFWLQRFFPNRIKENSIVSYAKHVNSFLQLAQDDWKMWNEVQAQAGNGFLNQEVPKKYILIGHSMGGLTTRDYITSTFYKGDVDKLITLDSPHEGSAIANYVKYWKDAQQIDNLGMEFVGAGLLLSEFLMWILDPSISWSKFVSILGTTAGLCSPEIFKTLMNVVAHKMGGYDANGRTDYGIDVLSLDDSNLFGLYQSNTKEFLKIFNNRSSLIDAHHNGYQLPYFRLVTTSGIPTPGGPGMHQIIQHPTADVHYLFTLLGGLIPYFLDGEKGVFTEDITGFSAFYKLCTALFMNSFWNDWGSGFVPHWSSEGKNVSIFKDAKADTKRWNITYEGAAKNYLAGFVPLLISLGTAEFLIRKFGATWDNFWLKLARGLGYVGILAAYAEGTDFHDDLLNFIGYHGYMVKRVDEDNVGVKTRGGAQKKVIDDLLWEKPSVSIVYTPVNPQDKTNSQGGRVGLSTTKETVEYTKSSLTKNENDEYVVDVKWKGETVPHVFDFSLVNSFDADGNQVPKTVNIVGKYSNTVINGIVLNKIDGSKSVTINSSNCTAIPWTVVNANEGNFSCNVPMLEDDKGKYTMQLIVDNPTDVDATYGVMVDVDYIPGKTFVDKSALFDAQDGDWDRYITFKNRRKQVKANGDIDETVADMVDYRRASNLVVNKLPRVIDFEVDDLQPDRMNRLSVDFNYGSAKIEFEAVKDPNTFDIAPPSFDANAVSHGFVDTKEEKYRMKMSIGSQSCETEVKNPVDAWGKWTLNLDELQKKLDEMRNPECGIKTFQPFLEGQNHIRVFSENRWLMTRSQDLNIFIPGPPPAITLIYPRNGEVFCGSSTLEFETNLIYPLSSELSANDVSIYFMKNGQRVDVKSNELKVEKKSNSSSITAYRIYTNDAIAWPKETVASITVKPKILGSGVTPYTYLLHISQDCVAPTVVFDKNQGTYNPTSVEFESFDQKEDGGEHLSIEDEIIELKSKDGTINRVLSAYKFTAPGSKSRSIELKDDVGKDLPDGKYELSIRVHDDAVKDKTSDDMRRAFWDAYKDYPNNKSCPFEYCEEEKINKSYPFAEYCEEEKIIEQLTCMTHWTMASTEVIIDHTAPLIENPKFILKQNNQEFDFKNNQYAGSVIEKDLALKMTVSDPSLYVENAVEFNQSTVVDSRVNVKWTNETKPHVFDLTLKGLLTSDDNIIKRTVNIVGLHPNTTIKGIVLKKVDDGKLITIDNTNCSAIPTTGWIVKSANEGKISCVIPMTNDDKGLYTMQLIVANVTNADAIYGALVNVGRTPVASVPKANVEFVQVDANGKEVPNGHSFVQSMNGEYENGKFVYNHDVIRALTENLRNQMNGYQPVPDGIYKPVIKVIDAANNVAEKQLSLIYVDMTAPKITEYVPNQYAAQSGKMHIVTFKADESLDDETMRKLRDMQATVTAECGDKKVSYSPVSAVERNSQIKYAFEMVIPTDIKGECIAKAEVSDVNGNVRFAELPFVVDFIPPEITYPEKPKKESPAELSGRVVIRGSAGNPNLRNGGVFTKYELTYAEIEDKVDADGKEFQSIGSWQHFGMFVHEGRQCDNFSNVSCYPVGKNGNGDDILGYWDLSKLPENAKGKNYRIKVESFNMGGFSAYDFVDVYVPVETRKMPSITISESTPNHCNFSDNDAICNIRWNTDFPLQQKSGKIRMEIIRTNKKSQKNFVDVERIFNNLIPKEYYGAPSDASVKGVYFWIDESDVNKKENIYHLRLVAGQSVTSYNLVFTKTKNAEVKITAEGEYGDLSQPFGEVNFSLNVSLNAGEARSYIIKSNAKSTIGLSLQSSNVQMDDDIAGIKFLYSLDPNQDEMFFVGEKSKPLVSMLHQGVVDLPLTSSVNQFEWDGKNDAFASVPSGDYRIVLTLESLEDGAYDVASKDITVVGKPIVLSNVDATPKQVPFDVSYMENNLLKPVNVTFSFNIDQDAIVSAFVRSVDGGNPTCEYLKLSENGKKVILDQFYLAGRKENYRVNWDGHYDNTSQAKPGKYEFVVQIYGLDGKIVDDGEKKVEFTITDEHMLVDGDVELKVDGRDDNHMNVDGKDYQIVDGMNDAILQFVPTGKTVVTDEVPVTVKYSGSQKVTVLPFERYQIGVQIHKTTASFWIVGAMSFRYNNDDPTVGVGCGHTKAYSNRILYYGNEDGPVQLTFNEKSDYETIRINFDSGDNGTDFDKSMKKVNATLLLIPTYLMSSSDIKKYANGKNLNAAGFKEAYKELREKAATEIVYGHLNSYGNIYFDSGDGSGIDTYDGNEDDIYGKPAAPISINTSDYYWDRRCDVGPNAESCLPTDDLKPDCSNDFTGKCGNGVADDGEPLLAGSERYSKEKHSAQFDVKAWAWRNYQGQNKDFDPPGCTGDEGARHEVMLIAQIKPSTNFWGTNGSAYGNGNLVNRYLTLDPMNYNFLFCAECPYSSNKTPYLNPKQDPINNHSQYFYLGNGGLNYGGQFLKDPLYNPNFQRFSEVNGEVKFYDALQSDVQLILHYFGITPNNAMYSGQLIHTDVFIMHPQRNFLPPDYFNAPAKNEFTELWKRDDYVEGGYLKKPISLAYMGGANTHFYIKISLPWSDSYNLSQENYEIDVPWPLKDATSLPSTCGPAGCGSSIDDLEPILLASTFETENVECDSESSTCYKVFDTKVSLGPQNLDFNSPYLDNGYDLQPYLKGVGQTITSNNPRAMIQNVDIEVPTGYKVDGSIVRKASPDCDNNGCDYVANQDPLIAYADFDDDDRISEDGSVVALTKRMPYEGDLDKDGDLAMGEDPDDAFRVRVPSMSFDFLPGAEGSETNLREICLGNLAADRLTELQQRAVDRGKIPGTVPDESSVFKQLSSGVWADNPLAKTRWENVKLFYKDGKVNDDVKIVRRENLDNPNAMLGRVWIGPSDFNGRDRRLLEVHAKIPDMKKGDVYKLYASSEMGWIDLTPSKSVSPQNDNAVGFDGLIAYWDVETSGMHQLMLVRTVGKDKMYKIINVFVGAITNDENTLYSDAMGRSQVHVASGSPRIDVIPLGKDEVPQIIPSNKNLGPVVKIYPSVSTIGEDVELKLRFNRKEVQNQGWINNGSMYVVSDGCSPQRVDGLSYVYYDENNHRIPDGVDLSSSGWSYVIISGIVKNSEKQKAMRTSVKLGENVVLDDASISVTETKNGVYNIDFNLDSNQ